MLLQNTKINRGGRVTHYNTISYGNYLNFDRLVSDSVRVGKGGFLFLGSRRHEKIFRASLSKGDCPLETSNKLKLEA